MPAVDTGQSLTQTDESDNEERTSDARYSRSRNTQPVYELDVGALHWAVYDAYDEQEGFECHWHKICARGNASAALNADGAASVEDATRLEWSTAVVDRALMLLLAWKAHQHQLLLNVRQVWQSSPTTLEVVASFSGVPDLRKYLMLHQHLGEPAIRKIARQTVKAMIVMTRHTHCPVHKLTIQDVHIKAGNGRIVVLPTFIWRPLRRSSSGSLTGPLDVSDPRTRARRQSSNSGPLFSVQGCGSGANSFAGLSTALSTESLDTDEQSADVTGGLHGQTTADASRRRSATEISCEDSVAGLDEFPPALQFVDGSDEPDAERGTQAQLLVAWVRIVLELYLRKEDVALWSVARLREALEDPGIPPEARTLLGVCLDEEQAQELPLLELLDHPWLNTRRAWAAPHVATSRPTNDMESIPENTANSSKTLSVAYRISSPGMSSTRRFSALGNGELGASPVLREIFDAAVEHEAATITAGTLTGDDYQITAAGQLDEAANCITFTVKLVRLSASDSGSGEETYKVLSFPYDVYHDTIEGVAAEMAEQFSLSVTDREMAASAMREVIARQLPGLEFLHSVHSSLAQSLTLGSTKHSNTSSNADLQAPLPPVAKAPLSNDESGSIAAQREFNKILSDKDQARDPG